MERGRWLLADAGERLTDAERAFRMALARSPDIFDALLGLSECLARQKHSLFLFSFVYRKSLGLFRDRVAGAASGRRTWSKLEQSKAPEGDNSRQPGRRRVMRLPQKQVTESTEAQSFPALR
jgi:hypothetical protein